MRVPTRHYPCQSSWRNYYLKPFETGVGVYVILNGALSFSYPPLAGALALLTAVGWAAYVIWAWQIIAGLLKLVGIGCNRSDVEVPGLILVTSIFICKVGALLLDGAVTVDEMNSFLIGSLIVVCNSLKIHQILTQWKSIYFKSDKPVEF